MKNDMDSLELLGESHHRSAFERSRSRQMNALAAHGKQWHPRHPRPEDRQRADRALQEGIASDLYI